MDTGRTSTARPRLTRRSFQIRVGRERAVSKSWDASDKAAEGRSGPGPQSPIPPPLLTPHPHPTPPQRAHTTSTAPLIGTPPGCRPSGQLASQARGLRAGGAPVGSCGGGDTHHAPFRPRPTGPPPPQPALRPADRRGEASLPHTVLLK